MSNQQMQRKQQVDTVRGALEKLQPQMAMALPKHLTPDRLLRVTMTAVQNTPKLLDCDRTSLFAAVLTCAQLGLEPDGVLGQAYLVPFKGKVQFIPGYKGYLTLARNSGEISSIQAHEVCQNDEFSYAYGLDEHLHHVPATGERGEVTHFYAYAKYKDGGHIFEVLTRADVNKIRDNSEGYKAFKSGAIKSNPWDSHYVQMGRKTAIRRLANYLPLSVQRAAALDAAYEGGKHAGTDEYGDVVIEGEGHEVETGQEETGGNGATSRLDALAGGQGEGQHGGQQGGPGAGNGQQQGTTPTHDIDGVPWDERIHSVNRTVTPSGQWRRKKGIEDHYFKKVMAEITAPQDGNGTGASEATPTGPNPDDPITRVIQRMEETQDRDTLDEQADEALNGTDLNENDRQRITTAYNRNAERIAEATQGGGGRRLFGDD